MDQLGQHAFKLAIQRQSKQEGQAKVLYHLVSFDQASLWGLPNSDAHNPINASPILRREHLQIEETQIGKLESAYRQLCTLVGRKLIMHATIL